MKVDGGPGTKAGLEAIGPASAAAERAGYDGVFVPETIHDPFVVLTLAAQATERVELGTKVAIAFARSPMALAYTANDLQELSAGRLVLGLGTQVRPHILRRFSMPWSHPAARMREYVLALRAIWEAWNNEKPLDFRGEFYTHNLMNPLFCPPPNPNGAPKVMMAGVGTRMIEAAGEVADRFACHSFTSPSYLAEVIRPALARGAARAGRNVADIDVAITCYVATGNTPAEIDEAALQMRRQVAFYGSTPSYTAVLDHHGFGGLHEGLHLASRRGEWEAMGEAITDDVLETYCVVAPPDQVAGEILRRYGNLADRVSFYYLGQAHIDWKPIVGELQAHQPTP
ncbi:MAG: TIGR03617 family F420-dependent LLM class oxidoreductase [Acidimicrobiales bacterium]